MGEVCAGERAKQVRGPAGYRVRAEDTGGSLAMETQSNCRREEGGTEWSTEGALTHVEAGDGGGRAFERAQCIPKAVGATAESGRGDDGEVRFLLGKPGHT